jgi:serine/threonine-protein kinase HipA
MANPIPLDVYVNDIHVGVLSEDQSGLFVFTYLPGIPLEQLVSLTMPVRAESYKWGRGGLHPYFCMNLPEGAKKDLVRQQLGSAAQVTDIGLRAAHDWACSLRAARPAT